MLHVTTQKHSLSWAFHDAGGGHNADDGEEAAAAPVASARNVWSMQWPKGPALPEVSPNWDVTEPMLSG